MESAPRCLFFYEFCRLCLKNEGVLDVFKTEELREDIFACTGVKLSSSDNLPRKICVKCAEVVKSWKDLRLLACKNDAHLRTLFGSSQNDDDSECDDIIWIPAVPSHDTPSKPDTSISLNLQNSSKHKLSQLLEAGEENTEYAPVISQTISLRKDLFPPSTTKKDKESQSPTKRESVTEEEKYDKLLRLKVEEENRCKKVKSDDGHVMKYVCAVCCKGFDIKKKLYCHKREHNKTIHCPLDVCGKKFATKGDLQKHVRTHTGEKPYLCKICDKGFTQQVSLRNHTKAVHALPKKPKEFNTFTAMRPPGGRLRRSRYGLHTGKTVLSATAVARSTFWQGMC